jgi:hypothetical protein
VIVEAEKTVKQWLGEMKMAGFYGDYVARSGDMLIRGNIPRNVELENEAIERALELAAIEKKRKEIREFIEKKR